MGVGGTGDGGGPENFGRNPYICFVLMITSLTLLNLFIYPYNIIIIQIWGGEIKKLLNFAKVSKFGRYILSPSDNIMLNTPF